MLGWSDRLVVDSFVSESDKINGVDLDNEHVEVSYYSDTKHVLVRLEPTSEHSSLEGMGTLLDESKTVRLIEALNQALAKIQATK